MHRTDAARRTREAQREIAQKLVEVEAARRVAPQRIGARYAHASCAASLRACKHFDLNFSPVRGRVLPMSHPGQIACTARLRRPEPGSHRTDTKGYHREFDVHPLGRRLLIGVGGAAATALVLAGCAIRRLHEQPTPSTVSSSARPTSSPRSTRPARTTTARSPCMNQVYPFLMNTPYGSPDVKPDIATSAEFTSPTAVHRQAQVRPRVRQRRRAHLVRRQVQLRPPARDRRRQRPVVAARRTSRAPPRPTTPPSSSRSRSTNDQTFPQVLSSPAGPIVDEQVFSRRPR